MFLELKQTMLVSVCLYRNYQIFFQFCYLGKKDMQKHMCLLNIVIILDGQYKHCLLFLLLMDFYYITYITQKKNYNKNQIIVLSKEQFFYFYFLNFILENVYIQFCYVYLIYIYVQENFSSELFSKSIKCATQCRRSVCCIFFIAYFLLGKSLCGKINLIE